MTRVKPLFDHVGTDHNKLNIIFQLLNSHSPRFTENSIIEICYGDNEKRIVASKTMLIWMLQNLNLLNTVNNFGTSNVKSETFKKRSLLFSGDVNTLNEAINAIKNDDKNSKNKWYILEGKTAPDIYIETKDSIFVGEAKRTETNITTKTKWLNNRDQLIRHIDSLLDQPKNIYSFYILEGKNFKNHYEKSMKLYFEKEYFKSNLKHRDDELIQRALNSFIGFAFWEDIAKCLDIKFPDSL